MRELDLRDGGAASKPRALLDTNILVSGLIYSKGREHRILKLAEEGDIHLLLPEAVIEEAREVIDRKFPGYSILLEIFLSRVGYETIGKEYVRGVVDRVMTHLRDKKDAPILASALVAKPDYVVSGDRVLREDLKRCREVATRSRVCSTREFLQYFP